MAEHRFDQRDRGPSFQALANQCFDLLVIGADHGRWRGKRCCDAGFVCCANRAQDLASGVESQFNDSRRLRYLVAGDVAVVKVWQALPT